MTILEVATAADIIFVLTTDESQPKIWAEHFAPGVKPGNTLCWASGYNIYYNLITPVRWCWCWWWWWW